MGAVELGFLGAIKSKLAKRYTASGSTINATDLVKIINTTTVTKDDLVELIGPDDFEEAGVAYVSACLIDTDKIAVAYRDEGNSNYGTCVIGTTDGTSFTWGTPVVFESASTNWIAICKTDTNKIAIAYEDADNSSYGTCIVATISGTVPTFGTAVVFESASTIVYGIIASDTDKIAISYRDNGNSNYGTCIVATISGTVPSFGTAVVFESATTSNSRVCKTDTDKIAIAYTDSGNSNYGTCIVATISGTVPTFGTAVVFESASSDSCSITDIDTDKIAIAYRDNGNSGYGTCIIATISGTVPTFGTAVVFESANASYNSIGTITTSLIAISFYDGNNTDVELITATISGTVPTFGTVVNADDGGGLYTSLVVLDTSNVVIAYESFAPSNYGTAVQYNILSEDDLNGVAISEESATSRYIAVQPLVT